MAQIKGMTTQASERRSRSGRFVRQIEGYTAFLPNPLPPQDLALDLEMQTHLSKADRALGRLDGSIQTLPNPDLFVLMYVRREAVLSSQIEGTQASINDLLEVEADVFTGHQPSDVGEVLNYVAAMNHGLSRLNELPVSNRLIREIHEELMKGARGGFANPGEIRTTQNWIGPTGCTLNEASFVPPPPSSVPNALSDLEKFIHGKHDLPALIKIGLVHAQFETIHPFLDGNGRIGRLLVTFLLCEQKILQVPLLYLSYYFKQNRNEYYDLLQRTRTEGDWEAWLKFFLQGIAEVSNQATETARRIVALRERHRTMITDRLGRVSGNGIAILERLFNQPIVSVNTVREWIGTSYPAANSIVAELCEIGVLVETTGWQRNRRFRYARYIELFADL
ncbi:MAG: Fic family protein [Pseudomonadota bacterium]